MTQVTSSSVISSMTSLVSALHRNRSEETKQLGQLRRRARSMVLAFALVQWIPGAQGSQKRRGVCKVDQAAASRAELHGFQQISGMLKKVHVLFFATWLFRSERSGWAGSCARTGWTRTWGNASCGSCSTPTRSFF